jgi:hypothetical protein
VRIRGNVPIRENSNKENFGKFRSGDRSKIYRLHELPAAYRSYEIAVLRICCVTMNALLSPQLTTALLVLGTIQLSRQLDLEDPTIINYVRVFYAVSQLAVVGILFLIKTKVRINKYIALNY